MTKKIFSNLNFDNSYARLPHNFYQKILPTIVKSPKLISLNKNLAKDLNLNIDELKTKKGANFFAGNFIAPGSDPIAMAYAGHQFGHFTPQLGDGRAILLGEVQNKQGIKFDIQLKGSGPTSFSRNGDGRAALGPIIREYVISEAMHNLNIQTTRALAFVTTGETVFRETALPGAILTRVALHHIRVGTFEYFAAKQDLGSIKKLANYTIDRHLIDTTDNKNIYLKLLKEVVTKQAKLVASWMGIGFIHGVMNTDNTSIAGQTIDYGPCAFMDEYNPNIVFSSIDQYGRYSYRNQPYIMQWNLARFAQTILPLLDENIENAVVMAEETIGNFAKIYQQEWSRIIANKIGIQSPQDNDLKLCNELLDIMEKHNLDFTNHFYDLTIYHQDGNKDLVTHFLHKWLDKWQARLSEDKSSKKAQIKLMHSVNPVFIPRNHQIEKIIQAATEDNNFKPMKDLISILKTPYKFKDKYKDYVTPPMKSERVYQTFCGT